MAARTAPRAVEPNHAARRPGPVRHDGSAGTAPRCRVSPSRSVRVDGQVATRAGDPEHRSRSGPGRRVRRHPGRGPRTPSRHRCARPGRPGGARAGRISGRAAVPPRNRTRPVSRVDADGRAVAAGRPGCDDRRGAARPRRDCAERRRARWPRRSLSSPRPHRTRAETQQGGPGSADPHGSRAASSVDGITRDTVHPDAATVALQRASRPTGSMVRLGSIRPPTPRHRP